jgi:photosystem II stability/assembly factor-like uncharacterized protein
LDRRAEVGVFQIASRFKRKWLVIGLLSLTLAGAVGGGAAWGFMRCDWRDYPNQARASWVHPQEHYLFACGRVWHSTDNGRTWKQIIPRGLPLGLRDGQIAADRQPGLLYLGVVRAAPFSWTCPLCGLTRAQPLMYISHDGGATWALAYQFQQGPAGSTRFLGVNADPDYSEAGWVVLQRGDEQAYYGTNTGGSHWQKTCVEETIASLHCDPPEDLLEAKHTRPHADDQP